MTNEHRDDRNPTLIEENAVGTERTLSSNRLCESCGADLTGRRPQARFCSAKCRTAARRQNHQDHLTKVVAGLEEALAALKNLGGEQ